VALGQAGADLFVLEEHDGETHSLQRQAVQSSGAAEYVVRARLSALAGARRGRAPRLARAVFCLLNPLTARAALRPALRRGDQRGAALARAPRRARARA